MRSNCLGLGRTCGMAQALIASPIWRTAANSAAYHRDRRLEQLNMQAAATLRELAAPRTKVAKEAPAAAPHRQYAGVAREAPSLLSGPTLCCRSGRT